MTFCDYPIIRDESKLPLYLINMGQHLCQNHILRKDGYPEPQILYCTRGAGTLLLDGREIKIPPYTGVFLPALYPHEYYPDESVWNVHWVVPGGYAAGEILTQFGMTKPEVYTLGEVRTLEHIFRKMHEAIRSGSIFGNYKASGYLYDFLIEFYRLTSVKAAYGAPNSALMTALDYINSNYTAQISLDELCAVSGVSKQHICRLFKNTLGCRPAEYTAKRRIQTAKELLTGSDMSMEDIAAETGFCSASYFCKLFKRYEGITPTQFRNTI